MIKKGLNKKNLEYWKNEVFIKLHGEDSTIAELKAYKVCLGQEMDILKARIIKLEKKYEHSKKSKNRKNI